MLKPGPTVAVNGVAVRSPLATCGSTAAAATAARNTSRPQRLIPDYIRRRRRIGFPDWTALREADDCGHRDRLVLIHRLHRHGEPLRERAVEADLEKAWVVLHRPEDER